MIGTLIYRQALEAEKKREQVFSEGLKPEFLADPPDYVYGLLMANNQLRAGNVAEARATIDKIEEDRPPGVRTGEIDLGEGAGGRPRPRGPPSPPLGRSRAGGQVLQQRIGGLLLAVDGRERTIELGHAGLQLVEGVVE